MQKFFVLLRPQYYKLNEYAREFSHCGEPRQGQDH